MLLIFNVLQVFSEFQYFNCFVSSNSHLLNVENVKNKSQFISHNLSQGLPSFRVFKVLSKCEKKHITSLLCENMSFELYLPYLLEQ